MLALKSVKQSYKPPQELLELLETFQRMVNHSLAIGLAKNASSLKMLSLLSYKELAGYNCPSYYKLCAISRAAGILASRKKSTRRGFPPKSPYAVKPQLVSCYGFKVEKGLLRIPLGRKSFHYIPLTKHTLSVISEPGLNVRSFTLTTDSLSITILREVSEIECKGTAGVDRNLHNLTHGNKERVVRHDLEETIGIAESTRRIVSSFKRNDARSDRELLRSTDAGEETGLTTYSTVLQNIS